MASDQVVPIASLSLTHVNYNPEDPISYISAFLALVPQALIIVYATLVWSSREIEILYMLAGQLLCEAFNFVLKRLIKQERPSQLNGKGYGMPSSHSQFMGFFAVFFTLFLLCRHTPTSPVRFSFLTVLERTVASAIVCIGAMMVAISRVYLNYHTPAQVLLGASIGIGFAIFWFKLGSFFRRIGFFDWLLDSDLAKHLRMRDLLPREDLVEAGWQRWEALKEVDRQPTPANQASKKKKRHQQ